MTGLYMLIKACFLFLAVTAANNDDDTCAASPGGCAGKNEADANTLIQSGVRISGGLAPDLNAEDPPDSDLGDAGVDIDHMGLLETDGSDPTEHVPGEEIGPLALDEEQYTKIAQVLAPSPATEARPEYERYLREGCVDGSVRRRRGGGSCQCRRRGRPWSTELGQMCDGSDDSDADEGGRMVFDQTTYQVCDVPGGHYYCDGGYLSSSSSSGRDDCEARCSAKAGCQYISFWISGGENWCRLTSGCSTKQSQHHHAITMYTNQATCTSPWDQFTFQQKSCCLDAWASNKASCTYGCPHCNCNDGTRMCGCDGIADVARPTDASMDVLGGQADNSCLTTNCLKCATNGITNSHLYKCEQCKDNATLSITGECLESCSPGQYELPQTHTALGVKRECSLCTGATRRRRADSCTTCPDGHISQSSAGLDTCTNLQNTCDLGQCKLAHKCFDNGQDDLRRCLATKSPNNTCINLNEVWCGSFMTRINDCQRTSLGCYHLLLCHSPCVCTEWKQVRCGGNYTEGDCDATSLEEFTHRLTKPTSSMNYSDHNTKGAESVEPSPENSAKVSLMQRKSSDARKETAETSSLDDTLMDKCGALCR